MYALTQYEQTGDYDPTNPHQRIREHWAGDPGKWASFYWNKVPVTGELRGLGAGGWASIPGWGQMAIVGITGAIAGYMGWKKFGDRLRPTFKKLPIIGSQFAGLGRGRRRRRRR